MSDQQSDDDVTRVLKTVFTNASFHTSKFSQHLRHGTVEGKKWGVVISSKDPPQYPNFILNKLDTEHLIKTKKAGKIDEAHVVFAQREGSGFTYLGHVDAEKLYQQLQACGPSWVGVAWNSGSCRRLSRRVSVTMIRFEKQ